MPVGRVTVDDSKEAPHVTVGVPDAAVNEIQSFCPVVGVPVRFVVMDVILAVWPVMISMSKLSVLSAGVAELALRDETRGVTLLFVSVWVSVVPTTVPDGAA